MPKILWKKRKFTIVIPLEILHDIATRAYVDAHMQESLAGSKILSYFVYLIVMCVYSVSLLSLVPPEITLKLCSMVLNGVTALMD